MQNEITLTVRLGNKAAKHLYEIEIARGKTIVVDADTREQAAAIARKAGYDVCSVNMVG